MKLDESWKELIHCSEPEKGEIRAEEAVLRGVFMRDDSLEVALERGFQAKRAA